MSVHVIIGGIDTILVPPNVGLDTLMFMHDNPFRTCGACDGARVVLVSPEDEEGEFGMGIMPCPHCRTSGVMMYASMN